MTWVGAGFLVCALAVAAGAFGAHGLKARLTPEDLEFWETAARYLMYGGLALTMVGFLANGQAGTGRSDALVTGAALSLLIGTSVFSLTVGAIALGGPRWLGAVTPLGGLLMVLGLVLAAVSAWRG